MENVLVLLYLDSALEAPHLHLAPPSKAGLFLAYDSFKLTSNPFKLSIGDLLSVLSSFRIPILL